MNMKIREKWVRKCLAAFITHLSLSLLCLRALGTLWMMKCDISYLGFQWLAKFAQSLPMWYIQRYESSEGGRRDYNHKLIWIIGSKLSHPANKFWYWKSVLQNQEHRVYLQNGRVSLKEQWFGRLLSNSRKNSSIMRSHFQVVALTTGQSGHTTMQTTNKATIKSLCFVLWLRPPGEQSHWRNFKKWEQSDPRGH